MSLRMTIAIVVLLLTTVGCSSSSPILNSIVAPASQLDGKFDAVTSICVTWLDPSRPMCDLTFTLTNNTDVPQTVSGNIFLRVDGQVFQSNPNDQLNSGIAYVSTTVNPGETQMGRSSFQVPDGGTLEELWIGTIDTKIVSIPMGISTGDLFN